MNSRKKREADEIPQKLRPAPAKAFTQEVEIVDRSVVLPGTLVIPEQCCGLVIFAHGSGSSRLSPRNIRVAEYLQRGQLGTLLFDLLTRNEAQDRENIFDIELLASRLVCATRWVLAHDVSSELPLGYFGASTGAGAALWAAAELGQTIGAVVSRGGRPDLALPHLSDVTAPTLLIVGGHDEIVIELNQKALKHLRHSSLVIIPGATHLFEEAGALNAVSEHACQWFSTYLRPETRRSPLITGAAG